MGPQQTAGLLVGEEDDHEIARGELAGPRQVSNDREDHRVHPLHVDRSPPPDTPVPDFRAEGVDLPVGSLSRHDVEMAVDAQGRSFAICAGNADRDAHPARGGFVGRGLQPHLTQSVDHVRCSLRLARPRTVAEVAGVDADQVPAQLDHLIPRRRRRLVH